MTFFKVTLSLSAAFLFILPACHWEGKSKTEEAAKPNYTVSQIQLSVPMETNLNSQQWPFERKKVFHPKICIQDSATLESVVDVPFTFSHNNHTQTAPTDSKGCLTVPQDLSYNELASEHLIHWEAKLQPTRHYEGTTELKLAVNPWAGELVDLRYSPFSTSIPAERSINAFEGVGEFSPLKLFQERTQIPTTNLYIDSLTLNPHSHQRKGVSRSLDFQLSCQPRYRRLSIDGSFASFPIEFGEFNLGLLLFERTDASRVLIGSAHASHLPLREGKLSWDNIKLELQRRPRPNATLEWIVRLEPVGAEGALLPFEGIFRSTISSLESPVDSLVLEVTPGTHFHLDQSAPPTDSLSKPQLKLAGISYEYPQQVHDLSVDKDLNLTRKEVFDFIIDPVFYWNVHSPNTHSHREALEVGTRLKVRAVFAGGLSSNEDSEAPDGRVPYENMRYISSYETQAVVEANGINRLVVPIVLAHDFSEQLLFYSFVKVFLEIGPLEGESYDFDFAPAKIVAEFDPKKKQGSLFPFESNLSIDSLNKMLLPDEFTLVELPIAKSNAVQIDVPRKTQKLFKPKLKVTLDPFNHFLKAIDTHQPRNIINLDEKEVTWPKNFPALLTKKSIYEYYLNKPDLYFSPETSNSEVNALLRLLAKQFCPVYTKNSATLLKECESNPSDYVNIHFLEFVESVKSAKWKGADDNNIQPRVRVFKEVIDTLRTHTGSHTSENDENGYSFNLGFKLSGTDLLGARGGILRGSTHRNQQYWATERAETRDLRNRVEVMLFKQMNYFQSVIQLNLTVKTCFIFSPGTKGISYDGNDPTYFICQTGEREFLESWYQIVASLVPEGRSVLEQFDPKNRFLKMVRGSFRFRSLLAVMSEATKAIHLELVPDLRLGPTHLVNDIYEQNAGPFGEYNKDGGVFPGISRYRFYPAH